MSEKVRTFALMAVLAPVKGRQDRSLRRIQALSRHPSARGSGRPHGVGSPPRRPLWKSRTADNVSQA